MPQESQLAHRVLGNLALPYITNVSPANTDPHYVSGSTDLLTSINGYAERRPGFAVNVEATPTTFVNLQRLFTWDRFDGTFIEMACDVSSNTAIVYKRVVGSDASFVSIFTDTGSATPFDFVVSNNTVYFSNGHLAKKWDPVNGVSNWGIAVGSVNNASGPNTAGAGTSGSGSANAWTNPGNVSSAVSYATNTLPANPLNATNFGFSIAATNTTVGILITFDAQISASSVVINVTLLKAGNTVGASKPLRFFGGLSFNGIQLGGTSDLWGTTWTSNDENQTGFGVSFLPTGPNGQTASIRNVQATIYGLGGPSVTVSGSAGSMNATAGYTYVFCYGNSATGDISSPSPVSSTTGTFTNKLNVSVTLTASTDAQVNQIRLFRTTDGGGGTGGYLELPNSPFTNTSGAVTDNAADSALQIGSIAPTPTFNDPPTPMRGMVYFAGRIWGFSGNKVYFSGLEEINQGVPEECFPSGVAGNFWSFDEPVQGLGVAGIGANQVLAILCGGRLYAITGTTLDTFQRMLVSARRGCRNLTCISSLGGMMAWLDSSNQVWASNGSSLEELSPPIRPDLASLNPANCSLTFHTAGRFHWLVLSTGTQLFVYDVDQDQWMPPWSFAAQYIFSGETSPGNYVLMASNGTKALQMSTTAFNDNGSTYQPVAKLSLLSIVPDYGTRFSYIGMGSYNEPTRTGFPVTFQVTNNAFAIQDFAICNDDDPAQASYTSIVGNLVDTSVAFNRPNGQHLQQLVYQANAPAARWIGMEVKLQKADQQDKLYELFLAYKPLGGR